MLEELALRCRSYRRFCEDEPVSLETLRELVDLARLAPSGANRQPLKYMLANEPQKNGLIFPCLSWATYLTGWRGPGEGEKPPAYIIVLGDRQVAPSVGYDHGFATQNILLGAVEAGLGGCVIGSVQREKLREALAIPERYEILHVIALGKPKETVVVEEVGPSGDVKYWRDEAGVHHVPKRKLEDIIVG